MNKFGTTQPLTPAQLAALKADIDANINTIEYGPNTVQIKDLPNDQDAANAIADWYNLNASPAYWGWKSFLSEDDIYGLAVEGMSWSWTSFIGRSQGERDGWRQMVTRTGGLDPSKSNNRAAVADIFSGAGGAGQRNFLLASGRRNLTNAEKLFATATAGGAGQRGSTGNPDTMGAEGELTGSQVFAARNP